MFAGTFFPLTSKNTLVFNLAFPLFTYPIAIGPLTLGPNVPLVIFPISLLFSSNIFVDSLAIILFSGLIPTLSLSTPFSNWFLKGTL